MLPCHFEPKIYIFGFSKSAPSPRYTMLDSRLPPCNAILEARSPLSNTSSGAGALPLEVRIEYDSDRKFSKSKFFHCFLKNHLSPRFMLPCYCKPKIYLRFFEVCTYPSIQNFGLEAPPCNAISEGRPPPPLSKFAKFIWKPLFYIFHAILFIWAGNIFSVFRSLHLVKNFWYNNYVNAVNHNFLRIRVKIGHFKILEKSFLEEKSGKNPVKFFETGPELEPDIEAGYPAGTGLSRISGRFLILRLSCISTAHIWYNYTV